MRHSLHIAELTLLGGALLFLIITVFSALEPGFIGKATSGTSVFIVNSTPVNCVTNAGAGLNTVSFYCISTAEPVSNVLSNTTSVVAMYQYVPGQLDSWRVYNPNLPSYVVNDLQFLSRKTGYVLILNESHTFTFSGLLIPSTEVPFLQGWNLVGYPTNETQNVSVAFSNFNNLTQARTYDNPAGVHLIYFNPGGGTLTNTTPGHGYWVNATQANTWTVS